MRFAEVPITPIPVAAIHDDTDTLPEVPVKGAYVPSEEEYGDLSASLSRFHTQAPNYKMLRRYYIGDHPLAFASSKFREAFANLFTTFSDNLLPSVVQATADRLEVTGFDLSQDEEELGDEELVAAATRRAQEKIDARKLASLPPDPTKPPGSVPIVPDEAAQAQADAAELAEAVKVAQAEIASRRAWRLWERCKMPYRSKQVHKTALWAGDAYVIVWEGEDGKAKFYPHRPTAVNVCYDTEEPGEIEYGAKQWVTTAYINGRYAKYVRVNVYYPDRIIKYVSKAGKTGDAIPELPKDAKGFLVWTGDEDNGMVDHSYGRVPIFHFANDADLGEQGTSDFIEAIPIQNALNKAVADLMVSMEFVAYPQRWATGVEGERDPVSGEVKPIELGVNRIVQVANDLAKFGNFDPADIEKFIKVITDFRVEIARLTGTPLHYMALFSTSNISGETMKALDGRMVKKAGGVQSNFGSVWADAIQFALMIENKSPDGNGFNTAWVPAEVISAKEQAEVTMLRQQIGIDTETALKEIGVPRAAAEAMAEKKKKEADVAAGAMLDAFNKGEPDDSGE